MHYGRRLACARSIMSRAAAIIGLLLAAFAAAPAQPITVTLLGTGTPIPNIERFGPSTLVEAGTETLLIDCGRGVPIRLTQLHIPLRAVTAGLFPPLPSPPRLRLSHLSPPRLPPPPLCPRGTPLPRVGPTP